MTQYRRKLTAEAEVTALNVFTTLELSFHQLQARDNEHGHEEDLLTLFAFFDPVAVTEAMLIGNIYRESRLGWLTGGRGLKSLVDAQGNWDQEKFKSLLIDLSEVSLIENWYRHELNHCVLCLHPLVRDWIRLRTAADTLTFFSYVFTAALLIQDRIETLRDPDVPNELDNLDSFHGPLEQMKEPVFHIQTYEENLQNIQDLEYVDDDVFQECYEQLASIEGLFEKFLGDDSLCFYDEAERIYRRVITWSEKKHGPADLHTISCMRELSMIMNAQKRYQEAESVSRVAYQRWKELPGPEDHNTLQCLINLAFNLTCQEKYAESHDFHLHAAELSKKINRADDPTTLPLLANLSQDLECLGKYEEAADTYQLVLSGREKILEPDCNEIADTIFSLAAAREQQGAFEESMPLYERALPIYRKLFGDDDQHVQSCNEAISNLTKKLSSAQLCEDLVELD
jgi:tetratricopeptide (TPR) repeat protein